MLAFAMRFALYLFHQLNGSECMKVIIEPFGVASEPLKTTESNDQINLSDFEFDLYGDRLSEIDDFISEDKKHAAIEISESDVLNVPELIECRKHYYIYNNKFLECSFASNKKLTHLPESYKSDYISEYEFMYRDQSSEMNRELIETTETESVNLSMQGIPIIFLD